MSKTTKSLLCLCFVLSYQLCFAQTNGFIDKGKYEVKKQKSVSGSTYITLEAFEHENPTNRFHAAYHVNKIIFVPDKVGPFTLHVLENDFSIRAGAVSKKWVDISRLTVSKGDSLYVKIYLENDPKPLRE